MKRILLLAFFLLAAVPGFAQERTKSGTITANTSCVTLIKSASDGGVAIDLSGTFVGTVQFTGTADGATWRALTGQPFTSGTGVTEATAPGAWLFTATGMTGVRACTTAYTSGTITAALQAGVASPGSSGSASITAENLTLDTTGLATDTKQDTGNTSLGSIDTKLSSQATAAKQDTGNTSLGTISTNSGTIATNSGTIATNSGTVAGAVSSSRMATNPISGQSGVAGGSGTVGATTQRVVLATDVGLPTGANVIGHVIVDSGGGGGTQYTEGDTDASITGTALLWEDTSNTIVAASAAKPLPVSASGTFTGSGVFQMRPWADGTLASGAITSAMTGTTSTSLVGATASNYIYVTNCVFSNTDADTDTEMILQDGNGGTTLYTVPVPHLTSGAVVPFPTPLKVPTSGNALYVANVTTGATTKASCSGFKSTTSY